MSKTTAHLQQACNELTKKGFSPRGFDEIDIHPTTFLDNGYLAVSAEDGQQWADYFGEYRGGDMWIEPILEQFAIKHDCFWEWRDPGSIALYYL